MEYNLERSCQGQYTYCDIETVKQKNAEAAADRDRRMLEQAEIKFNHKRNAERARKIKDLEAAQLPETSEEMFEKQQASRARAPEGTKAAAAGLAVRGLHFRRRSHREAKHKEDVERAITVKNLESKEKAEQARPKNEEIRNEEIRKDGGNAGERSEPSLEDMRRSLFWGRQKFRSEYG